jgi:peptidyl-prolyl cis-trans isomerase SurA
MLAILVADSKCPNDGRDEMRQLLETMTRGLRGAILAAGLAVVAASGSVLWDARDAAATSIVVLVNNEPITEYDVAQRTRLVQAISGGSAGRSQAIEELIEEKLKQQSARRLGIAASDSEVEAVFRQFASNTNLSPSQFVEALGQIGVHQDTLKTRIRSELLWRDVVNSQLRREVDIREPDVEAALSQRGEAATSTSVELTMRQIMFVIPADSSQEYVRRREQEANRFRAEFSGCDTARELARNYRDTVVRQEVRRSSNDLPPRLRETLLNVPEGQVSPPSVGEQAVEMVAVCARREVQDTGAARAEIQDSMISEQGERLARRLMIDLKQAAIIERR